MESPDNTSLSQEPFPREAHTRALSLFLSGEKIAKIAETITQEFDRPCRPLVIYRWANKEKWDEIKADAQVQAMTVIKESKASEIAQRQQEHIASYEKIWKSGMEKIETGDLPEAKSPVDIARMVDIGIQGEIKIRKGILGAKFIDDVFSVIVEEVTDEEALKRIASRLRKLAADLQSN